jgi:hypothetical protein
MTAAFLIAGPLLLYFVLCLAAAYVDVFLAYRRDDE